MLRSYLLVAEKSQNSKPIYSLATLQQSSLKDFLTISESSWRGLVRSNDKGLNIGLWKFQNVQSEILPGNLTASSADREQILLVLSLSNALRCNLHKNGNEAEACPFGGKMRSKATIKTHFLSCDPLQLFPKFYCCACYTLRYQSSQRAGHGQTNQFCEISRPSLKLYKSPMTIRFS